MNLPYAVDVAIPVVVFFLMWLVGLRVTGDDLRRALDRPRMVVTALLAQVLVLPLLALGAGWLVGAGIEMQIALLLIAATPAGVLSNAYTLVARGTLALSVTLTATGTLLGVVTLPLVAGAGLAFLAARGATAPDVLMGRLLGELTATILLPVGVGMSMRARVCRVTALERRLQTAGALATAALVGTILVFQWETVSRTFPRLGAATLLFTLGGSLVGYAVARRLGSGFADRVALALEFPCRNLGLAVLVANDSLGRPEVAGLASAFLLAQLPVLLLLSLALRRAGPSLTLATS